MMGSAGAGRARRGMERTFFKRFWGGRGRTRSTGMSASSNTFTALEREGNTYGLDEDQNSLEQFLSGGAEGRLNRAGEVRSKVKCQKEHLVCSCTELPGAVQLDESQRTD